MSGLEERNKKRAQFPRNKCDERRPQANAETARFPVVHRRSAGKPWQGGERRPLETIVDARSGVISAGCHSAGRNPRLIEDVDLAAAESPLPLPPPRTIAERVATTKHTPSYLTIPGG